MTSTLPLETRLLVKEAVKDTVEEVFLRLGIDTSTPESVVEIQRDWHYLRSNRLLSETRKNNTLQHMLNVIVAGMLAAVALSVANFFGIGQQL